MSSPRILANGADDYIDSSLKSSVNPASGFQPSALSALQVGDKIIIGPFKCIVKSLDYVPCRAYTEKEKQDIWFEIKKERRTKIAEATNGRK